MGRHEVIMELVKTERSYVKALHILEKLYISPMKEAGPSIGFTEADRSLLFDGLQSIITTNSMFIQALHVYLDSYLHRRFIRQKQSEDLRDHIYREDVRRRSLRQQRQKKKQQQQQQQQQSQDQPSATRSRDSFAEKGDVAAAMQDSEKQNNNNNNNEEDNNNNNNNDDEVDDDDHDDDDDLRKQVKHPLERKNSFFYSATTVRLGKTTSPPTSPSSATSSSATTFGVDAGSTSGVDTTTTTTTTNATGGSDVAAALDSAEEEPPVERLSVQYLHEWSEHLKFSLNFKLDVTSDIPDSLLTEHDLAERRIHQSFKTEFKISESDLLPRTEDTDMISPQTRSIGDIFYSFGTYLKTYTEYASKYQSSLNRLRFLRTTNAKFAEFLKTREDEAKKVGLLELPSYMIMPIQRLPRYPLLLQELLNHTESTHADYEPLRKALEVTKSVANYIDLQILEMNNRVKASEILKSIRNCPASLEDVKSLRKLVLEGDLLMSSAVSQIYPYINFDAYIDRAQQYHVYLFSDLIVYCEKLNSGDNNNSSSSSSTGNSNSAQMLRYSGSIDLRTGSRNANNNNNNKGFAFRFGNTTTPRPYLTECSSSSSSSALNATSTTAPSPQPSPRPTTPPAQQPQQHHHFDVVANDHVFTFFTANETEKNVWLEKVKDILGPPRPLNRNKEEEPKATTTANPRFSLAMFNFRRATTAPAASASQAPAAPAPVSAPAASRAATTATATATATAATAAARRPVVPQPPILQQPINIVEEYFGDGMNNK